METYMSKAAGCLTGAALFALVTATAQAAITYVDATDGAGGNTTLVDGSVWNPLASQGPANDGLWDKRAFGNSGTIYQNAQTGATDDAHRLRTTISGVTPGELYDVYVYFWSDVSTWRITAGLTDDASLLLFSAAGSHGDPTTANTTRIGPSGSTNLSSPVFSDPEPFTTAVMIGEGNRRLYQGYLGQGIADGSGQILVYIDDAAPNMVDSNQRTWYDGVGYQLVPEPASLGLLGLGGVRMLRRQRV